MTLDQEIRRDRIAQLARATGLADAYIDNFVFAGLTPVEIDELVYNALEANGMADEEVCETCRGKGYVERKVYTQEPAGLLGIAAATKVACPNCY